ncbi:Phage Mu protein F like protein [Marinibacterium anthonyi]|nr:Phage Mu protein F like protein [Marinibacterium anthonyi]
MANLATVFRRPFREQVAAFRLRLGNLVPTSRWDDLRKEQHDRAFVVAGAMKADLLADLGAAMDKAITEGTSLEEFRRDFRATVEKHGWHGWTGEGRAAGEAWRTRVIYRTNMRTSYMAGRYAQLTEGNFAFWIYFHGGSAEPRLLHLSWNGIALPPDHPFWAKHFPPNEWGCSCYVSGARTEAGVRRLGGDPDKVLPETWNSIDPRTGEPAGVGKGWGYAPGAIVVDDLLRIVRDKVTTLPPKIAAAFVNDLAERFAETALGRALREIADGLA